MQKELEEHLRYCQTLPTLSTVALRVIDLAGSPNTDFGEVAKCINTDPALATKILRVANSPFYGRRRKSDNLRQALTLLGLDNVVSLALSFSLTSSLKGTRQTLFDRDHYWRRSILSAIAARALGEKHSVRHLEELFLGGLLQDIGQLVLDCVMPDRYGTVANEKAHETLPETERRILGADHIEVGVWILKRWQLPEYLRNVVAFSHDPTAAGVPSHLATITRCVAASGLLAEYWLAPEKEPYVTYASVACRQWLDMDFDSFKDVMDTIASDLPDVAALFDIQPLDSRQVAGILEQAKDILTIRNLQLITEVKTAKEDAKAIESRTRLLETQASMDSLTGLFNRGWLDEALEREFSQATKQGWPLSIAFIDLDHFKQVNDTHGHLVGDQVLRSVAGLLSTAFRQTDLVARYGGEEFVVVLPGTATHAAQSVLERFLLQLRKQNYTPATGGSLRVTASIGVATHATSGSHFDSASDLLRAADRALYSAKRGGRNSVMVYNADS